MKKNNWYLLILHNQGNKVLNEFWGTHADAIRHFNKFNSLTLNEYGYAKYGETTYCTAEQYGN